MLTILSLIAFIYLLFGTIFFGARKKAYSPIKDTISELGEYGSKHARMVNYGLFLPVGLLLFVIAILNTDNTIVRGISICMGIGYVVAVFFPCDPGSPMKGSGRQQIHNIGGFIEYAGGLIFLMRAGEQDHSFFSIDYKLLGYAMIVCIIITSIPKNPIRGLAQRVAELILFGSLIELSFTAIP